MIAQAKPQMSLDDFVHWQQGEEGRYEFYDGLAYAMAGAENAHVLVSTNFIVSLRSRLRGTPFRVYGSDVNLRIDTAQALFHPDIAVSCDARDGAAQDAVRYPRLLIEVLSVSTESYDRGRKFAAYRRIAELREYVLVATDSLTVEVFRLQQDGHWALHDHAWNDTLRLESLELNFPVAELFEDIGRADAATQFA